MSIKTLKNIQQFYFHDFYVMEQLNMLAKMSIKEIFKKKKEEEDWGSRDG